MFEFLSIFKFLHIPLFLCAWPSDLARTKNWGNEILTDADLEGQLDLIIAWVMACMNSSTGHTHVATSNKGPKIPINSGLTIANQALGDVIYASASSAWARLAGNTTTTKKYLTQTGDGAASAAPAWSALANTDLPAGSVVQVVNVQNGAVATGSTVMPYDDTIPQNTEGDQYMTLAITPTSAINKLKIDVVFIGTVASAYNLIVALFQDITADALACALHLIATGANMTTIKFTHYMVAGTTLETTFKVRAGSSTASTVTFNGAGGARKLGGVLASSITITEIKV